MSKASPQWKLSSTESTDVVLVIGPMLNKQSLIFTAHGFCRMNASPVKGVAAPGEMLIATAQCMSREVSRA